MVGPPPPIRWGWLPSLRPAISSHRGALTIRVANCASATSIDPMTPPTTSLDTSSRILEGVVLHADIGTGGAPTNWAQLHRSPPGDPRGSSQNNLAAEFLGDYVYAVATRHYGAAVWNDARNAADCPAIDAWRQSLQTGGSVPRPDLRQQRHLRRLVRRSHALGPPLSLIDGVSAPPAGVRICKEEQAKSSDGIVGFGRPDCRVRTDSRGNIYVFWHGGDPQTRHNT
jgi:hypothetical protein